MNLENYHRDLSEKVRGIDWSYIGTVQLNTKRSLSDSLVWNGYRFARSVMLKVANSYHGDPKWFITPVYSGSLHFHWLLQVSGKRKGKHRETNWTLDGNELLDVFADQKMRFGFGGSTIRIEPFNHAKGAFDYYALNQNHQPEAFKNLDLSWLFYISKIYYMFSEFIENKSNGYLFLDKNRKSVRPYKGGQAFLKSFK